MSERVGSEAPKGDGEHFHFGNAAVRAGDVFRPVLRKVAATSLDGLEAALRDFAFDFTTKVKGFPPAAAWGTGEGRLQWMPVRRSAQDDPRWSSWIERRGGKGCEHGEPYDRTLVLIACLAFADPQGQAAPFIAYGLGGVRVLLHVDAPRDGKHLVRITAAISTVPRVILNADRRMKLIDDVTLAKLRSPEQSIPGFNLMLHLDPKRRLIYATSDEPAANDDGPVRRTVYRQVDAGSKVTWSPVRTFELRTGATAQAEVVRRDPPTRFGSLRDIRPQDRTRYPGLLQNATLDDDARLDVPAPVFLSGPDKGSVVPGDAALHSRDSAAWHGERLFTRLDDYGIATGQALAHAPGKLQILTYVAVARSTDGHTVNAEVLPVGVMSVARTLVPVAAQAAGQAAFLQARFALAERHSAPHGALALACDPRWVWHEFAHVLIYGLTGALEFAFAHSVGDALAAILFDPNSQLHQGDQHWPHGRGLSFPWVHLGRRHDRDVRQGWSWTGTMFRYPPNSEPGHSHQFGYWAEQIMSTTLFNLYRCLGGDAAAVEEREIAADQAVYLIIQAIGLLGCSQAATASDVVDYVWALKSIDVATTTLWLPLATAATPRLGGAAAKPVRWCFEQQGLYAAPGAPRPHDAPGEPPDVDIHVGSGDYLPMRGPIPITLAWTPDGSGQWHLGVAVDVTNRGTKTATKCDVHAWLAFGTDAAALEWDPAAWMAAAGPWQPYMNLANKLSIAAGQTKNVNKTFTGITDAQKAHCFVLIAITCPHDLSIIDPRTHLPCAKSLGPLLPLLRGDNNLALFEVAP